jgi:hypothetical protein
MPASSAERMPKNSKQSPVSPGRCDVCFATTDAIPPESPPTVSDPEPTGELLTVAWLGLSAIPPEHLGLVGALQAPRGPGVDVRSDSLFVRHTLRC